jgi:hypothetical protein
VASIKRRSPLEPCPIETRKYDLDVSCFSWYILPRKVPRKVLEVSIQVSGEVLQKMVKVLDAITCFLFPLRVQLLQPVLPRVHAKCNSVLHSARPRVLHSSGGPYITCIAKQMDQGFAGTQLYRQRVCFFLPLNLLTLDQHNQCKFV